MDETPQPTYREMTREARVRLDDLAAGHRSYRGPYPPDRLRGDSVELLWRWAKANARANDDVTADWHADLLRPIALGHPSGLDEARQAGGVGALLGDDRPPAPTLDQFEHAVKELLGGAA